MSIKDSGVILLPNGEIQYFTKSIKNVVDIDIEANIPIEVISEVIPVILYNKAIIVRCLCLLDFSLNLFVMIYTCYINVYNTFIAMISLMAYISTMTYNRHGLFLYLGYQYFKTVDKIMILVIDDYDLDEIMIFMAFTAGQIYITYFIQNFYSQCIGK